MRQEMRNLNRAKYAHSDEEMKQLASQGFVPVGQVSDDNSQAAGQTQASDDGGQSAGQAQESDDGGQSASQNQTSDPSVQKKRKDAGRK